MNKIKLWPTTGKNQGLIIIFIVLCFLMVMGIFLVWGFIPYKEGLYVNVADNTVKNLDRAVDAGLLPRLNDVENSGAPIVFSSNQPVAKNDITDPEFPSKGSVLQCSMDDINGNGSYYLVSNTNPKTINLFPNEDPSIINSWSDTWGSAPSFKNCSAFVRGTTMEKQVQLPNVGTDIRCKNENSQANRHTYRVMSRTRIQPFPGREEDPNQIVAKSWDVNENKYEIVDDCSNINKVIDDNKNVITFKYKVDVGKLDGQLVKCRQSAPGSNRNPPGNHDRYDVYKVEGNKLRWFKNIKLGYTSLQNIISWGLGEKPVNDLPSCDSIALGEDIRYNSKLADLGPYSRCSIDVSNRKGAGIDQLYKVEGDELKWIVSKELASFFDPNFNTDPNAYGTYPDCSAFKRGEDITYGKIMSTHSTNIVSRTFKIPDSCTAIYAITVGGGGGGGGGCGTYYKKNNHISGGGAGGGGGGGGVSVNNGTFIPINDNNRNNTFGIVVGSGGEGGKRGNKNVWNGNNTSGTNGGDSYFYQEKNNIRTKYFVANGGKGGEKGKFAKDWRGQNGNGGAGGTFDGTYNTGYVGTNGQTIPYNQRPEHSEIGGNGGVPSYIPNEMPRKEEIGIGGKGGTGSVGGHDTATAGGGGSVGNVIVFFKF